MLSPKPKNTKPLLGWDDLDSKLQAVFKTENKSKEPIASIDPGLYQMSPDEIKTEAEKQGYKVTIKGQHIIFE